MSVTWGSMRKTAKNQAGPLCFGILCSLPFWAGVVANFITRWFR
jgi:hypothetical protein